jgi:hypothetical protein
MKKVFTLLLAFSFYASFTNAQITLHASTNNPVPGDGFIGHVVDTNGVTMGAAGPSVTWNFAALVDHAFDTVYYYTCPTTPACDSFSTSNVVAFNHIYYGYDTTSSSAFAGVGIDSGGRDFHITGTYDILVYPYTFNTLHKDTSTITYSPTTGVYAFQATYQNMVGDGYGTLILPTGTFTNVLRIHRTAIVHDSIEITGLFSEVTTVQTDFYEWYDTTGFHNPLYTITYDTTSTGVSYVSSAVYYKTGPPLGLNNSVVNGNSLAVYPNPVSDVINVNFSLTASDDATITLTDLMGRIVNTLTYNKLNSGLNKASIPTSTLPPGIYLLRLQSSSGYNTTQKVVVEK